MDWFIDTIPNNLKKYFSQTIDKKVIISNTQEAIDLALQGEQSAYTYILDQYWNEVYNFMLTKTKNETDAEDITVETFSKAFERLNSYNPTYQFNTWLITIARNTHIDLVRKRKSERMIDIDENDSFYANIIDETPGIEDQLINEQNLITLKNYIKQLKPHYQEIIQLRYFQELTYKEIADKLDEPLNNVKVKILRAKKLLTELIIKK